MEAGGRTPPPGDSDAVAGLLDDLRIRKQERDVLALDARPRHEDFNIFPELLQAVATGDLDHDALHLAHKRSHPRRGLFAGTADAHQHRVAAGLP